MIEAIHNIIEFMIDILIYIGLITGITWLIMYLLNYIKKSTTIGYYFFYFLRYRKYIIKWLKDNRKVD